MSKPIQSIAVLGAGTMGSGIAALCAENDCEVLLLDVSMEASEKGLNQIINSQQPTTNFSEKNSNISLGTFENHLEKITKCDWICKAIIEDLEAKRKLIKQVENFRQDGSIVSTNTSGIPLRDITDGLPERLQKDMVVTHFF